MKSLLRIVAAFLLVSTALSSFPRPATAQGGIMVWPTRVELKVNSGESTTQTLSVENQDSEAVRICCYAMDFSINRGDDFIFSEPGHESYSASKWLSVQENEFELAPGEIREIEVAVSPPSAVEPGGHYAAFFFEVVPGPDQGMVSISMRIPSLFYITVPGLTEADIFANADVVSIDMPGIAEKGPIETGVLVRNSGNVHLTVAAKAYFSGPWGNNGELDLGQITILPNSEGVMKADWKEPPFLGKVKASVVIGYLDEKGELVNKSQTTEFWVIPWTILASGTAGLFLLVSASVIVSQRYRFKIERK